MSTRVREDTRRLENEQMSLEDTLQRLGREIPPVGPHNQGSFTRSTQPTNAAQVPQQATAPSNVHVSLSQDEAIKALEDALNDLSLLQDHIKQVRDVAEKIPWLLTSMTHAVSDAQHRLRQIQKFLGQQEMQESVVIVTSLTTEAIQPPSSTSAWDESVESVPPTEPLTEFYQKETNQFQSIFDQIADALQKTEKTVYGKETLPVKQIAQEQWPPIQASYLSSQPKEHAIEQESIRVIPEPPGKLQEQRMHTTKLTTDIQPHGQLIPITTHLTFSDLEVRSQPRRLTVPSSMARRVPIHLQSATAAPRHIIVAVGGARDALLLQYLREKQFIHKERDRIILVHCCDQARYGEHLSQPQGVVTLIANSSETGAVEWEAENVYKKSFVDAEMCLKIAKEEGWSTLVQVAEKDRATAVMDAALAVTADWIVLGGHEENTVNKKQERAWHRLVEKCIQSASCPVMVLRLETLRREMNIAGR